MNRFQSRGGGEGARRGGTSSVGSTSRGTETGTDTRRGGGGFGSVGKNGDLTRRGEREVG